MSHVWKHARWVPTIAVVGVVACTVTVPVAFQDPIKVVARIVGRHPEVEPMVISGVPKRVRVGEKLTVSIATYVATQCGSSKGRTEVEVHRVLPKLRITPYTNFAYGGNCPDVGDSIVTHEVDVSFSASGEGTAAHGKGHVEVVGRNEEERLVFIYIPVEVTDR